MNNKFNLERIKKREKQIARMELPKKIIKFGIIIIIILLVLSFHIIKIFWVDDNGNDILLTFGDIYKRSFSLVSMEHL